MATGPGRLYVTLWLPFLFGVHYLPASRLVLHPACAPAPPCPVASRALLSAPQMMCTAAGRRAPSNIEPLNARPVVSRRTPLQSLCICAQSRGTCGDWKPDTTQSDMPPRALVQDIVPPAAANNTPRGHTEIPMSFLSSFFYDTDHTMFSIHPITPGSIKCCFLPLAVCRPFWVP